MPQNASDLYFGTAPNCIPEELCRKAVEHNDQLTRAERWLFLSLGTLEGKLLADPTSVTEDELNEVRNWPPPDVLSANIQASTGLVSVGEVMQEYWNPDRTERLGFNASQLITLDWWTFWTREIYEPCTCNDDPPTCRCIEHTWQSTVVGEAACELAWEMRPEQVAFERAVRTRWCGDMPIGDDIELELEQKYSMSPEDWQMITQQRKVEIKAMDDRRWREMRAQLDEELKDATKAELDAIHELRKLAHIEEIESLRRAAEEKTTKEREEKPSRHQHIDKRKSISLEEWDDEWAGNLFGSTDE